MDLTSVSWRRLDYLAVASSACSLHKEKFEAHIISTPAPTCRGL